MEDLRVLDSERVLVFTRNSGRGKASGLEVKQISTKGANVFHLRGGKVTRLVAYWQRDHAFADLGLIRQRPQIAREEERAPDAILEAVDEAVSRGHGIIKRGDLDQEGESPAQ
jgi:hypothetical protein